VSVDALDVFLEGRLAGRLEWDRRAHQGSFAYDDAYRRSPSSTPLSTALPLAPPRHRGEAVTAYLWGLLPDNQVVLDRWGQRFQVSVADPMGLLASLGSDLPGAVATVEPGMVPATVDGREDLTEADLEVRLAALRADQASWLGADGRWSLGGAQAKLALAEVDGRWSEPHGAFATNRILKPAIAGLPSHDLNEHLCLDACRRLGLLVELSRVQTFGAERAIVVERYDRASSPDGSTQVRIHQEDCCQALGVRPSGTYQSDGGPGAVDVVRLLRSVVDPIDVPADVDRFVDALIVNWLLAAPDAHAKNYSLPPAGWGQRAPRAPLRHRQRAALRRHARTQGEAGHEDRCLLPGLGRRCQRLGPPGIRARPRPRRRDRPGPLARRAPARRARHGGGPVRDRRCLRHLPRRRGHRPHTRLPGGVGLTPALRFRAGRGSAVDAVVVATAERGGRVLTGDPDDLRALAAHADRVVIATL
jgi:serine/threonine-protein kinase HipA